MEEDRENHAGAGRMPMARPEWRWFPPSVETSRSMAPVRALST
jgi:hypothetical protein